MATPPCDDDLSACAPRLRAARCGAAFSWSGSALMMGACLVLGGPSYAADAPRPPPQKAPKLPAVAPAPRFGWTGCYIGGQVGGGWGHNAFSNPGNGFDVSVPPLSSVFGQPNAFDSRPSGLLGGGQAGCKYQFAGNWVVGIEGDASTAHLVNREDTNFIYPPTSPLFGVTPTSASFLTKIDWLASATASLGYSFDRLLIYGKGGAAWDHAQDRLTGQLIAPVFDFEAGDRRTGWTAGAGLEYNFWKDFSADVEYDYYDFGRRSVPFAGAVSPSIADIKQQPIHAIKFGLNYYFWNVPGAANPAAAPADLPTKAPVAAPAPSLTWTETFSTESRYFSWSSNRGYPTSVPPSSGGGSGSELYVPYATKLVGQADDYKIELLARGGWVSARQTTAGLSGEVSTATDTVGSGTFTYLGFNGFQPFAALSLNLPTGQSALFGPAANARMDPDLVDIASFGEGFNVGPTVGFNIPITPSLIVTSSIGYTFRGDYLREDTLAPIPGFPPPTVQTPTMVAPGDAFSGTTSVGWKDGPLTGKVTGSVTESLATFENGVPQYRAGTRYLGTGTWSYAWPEVYGVTTLVASAAHSNRNEVTFETMPVLVKEISDTNSNLYRIGLEHLVPLDRLTIGPTGSFIYRDHNGYDATTLQFVPAKERWEAGMLARFAATDNLTLNARAAYIRTRENENPAPGDVKFDVLSMVPTPLTTVPVVSSNGWQVVLGATGRF